MCCLIVWSSDSRLVPLLGGPCVTGVDPWATNEHGRECVSLVALMPGTVTSFWYFQFNFEIWSIQFLIFLMGPRSDHGRALSVSQSVNQSVMLLPIQTIFTVAMPLIILSLWAIVFVAGDMGYSFLLGHSRVKLHAKNVKPRNLPSYSIVIWV